MEGRKELEKGAKEGSDRRGSKEEKKGRQSYSIKYFTLKMDIYVGKTSSILKRSLAYLFKIYL